MTLTWVSRDSATFELAGEDDGGARDGEDGARLWQRQAATGGRTELTLAGAVASSAFTIVAGEPSGTTHREATSL